MSSANTPRLHSDIPYNYVVKEVSDSENHFINARIEIVQ